MTSFFEQWLIENWRKDFGGDRPGRISIVKTASSGAGLPAKERESKIFLLAFHGKSSRPFAVAKIPRFAHAAPKLKKEHDTLTAMHAGERLDPEFLRTVPYPLFFGNIGKEIVSVQTILNGSLFRPKRKSNLFNELKHNHIFSIAASWLNNFRKFAHIGTVELTQEIIDDWFINPLYIFSTALRYANILNNDILFDIYSDAESIIGTQINLSHQHGDFTLSNILFYKRICKVFDYEHYGLEKNPLFDIFWLARNLWYPSYGFNWIRSPIAKRELHNSAHREFGENSLLLKRTMYTQALLKSFSRKFFFYGGDSFAANLLAPSYIEELEALRGVFAA